MSIVTPPLAPSFCVDCERRGFWRYRDRGRWHCVACCPCPDPDDALFFWNRPEIDAVPPDHGEGWPEEER